MEYKEITITPNYVEYYAKVNGVISKIHKEHKLDVHNIRKELQNINYQKKYNKLGGKSCINKELENFMIPPIVYVYYSLFVRTTHIPNIDEISNCYIKTFCIQNEDGTYSLKEQFLNKQKNITFQINELEARIARAYNSFNRELELLANLSVFYKDKLKIAYKFSKDYYKGIDILLQYNEKQYGLATYIHSKRSNQYRSKKVDYRHDFSNINMISVVAYLSGENCNMKYYGDVATYSDEVVHDIYKQICN